MVFSIIQKSQLEGAYRLDAEYYQPECLELANNLRSRGSVLLNSVVEKVNRGVQPIYSNTGNVLALKSVYLRSDFIDDTGDEFVDDKFYEKNEKAQIHKNDVLLNSTGVGTLGRSNYYYLDQKAVADGHVTIIRMGTKLSPLFLDAFLKSKYGQFQINRLFSGSSGQIEIYPADIGSIEIVLPGTKNDNMIRNLCRQAHDGEKESKNLFSEAKNLFLQELHLDNFKQDNFLSTIVNLSEVEKEGRVDAEYFNSPCTKMLKEIMKGKTMRLGDLADLVKGVEPGAESYQDEGKLFIRVSSVSTDGIVDKDQKYLSDDLYNELKKDYQPQAGEILLTKDASIGVACVVREAVEGIVAGGVLRLQLKDKINVDYLTLVFNSIVGRLQAERDAGGSIIAHWKPEQIKNLIVPILSDSLQQKIGNLILKSHEARKKAKELLEEAKLKVEEMIEKGGEK